MQMFSALIIVIMHKITWRTPNTWTVV